MKRIIVLLSVFMISISAFAQKRSKAGEVDINNIKRYYERIKDYGINPKEELLWTYTYSDTSEANLNKISEIFKSSSGFS